jgi:hypothetical protein
VLGVRQSSRLRELLICLGTAAVCGLAAWLIAANRTFTGIGDLRVPESLMFAVLFLPALIIRPGRSSSLSTRVDLFQRATRRIAVLVAIGLIIFVALSELETASWIQAGWIEPSGEVLWVTLIDSVGDVLLLVLALYGWLHLRLLTLSVSAHNWSWSRYLRQEAALGFSNADKAVSAAMTRDRPAGRHDSRTRDADLRPSPDEL